MRLILLIVFSLTSLYPTLADACAAFSFVSGGHILIGANTDSCEPVDGLITVNKRGIHKKGSSPSTTGMYAEWISVYGSVTFTYCCREIAQYGMNEAGLVITTVALPGSKGPQPDKRPPLDGNIWSQYLLDTCATIDEVIETQSSIRIVDDQDQYLMCDRNGNTLIVECRDGTVIYYRGESLPSSVLTNARYSDCLQNWQEHRYPADDPYISFRRFNIGSDLLSHTTDEPPDAPVPFAFEVLDSMSQDPCTQWNLVFDVTAQRIYYRTKNTPHIKHIDLAELDYSCDTPMLEQNIHIAVSGNTVSRFKPYSPERNLNLMRSAFKRFGIERTEEQLHQIIEFFDDFSCDQ